MSTYVCKLNLCIYVKPMNSMVLGNKQYNTKSDARVFRDTGVNIHCALI